MKPSHAGGDGRWHEVLIAFFGLGCTSFGGPVAHFGYFRAAFVERRQWLSPDFFSALLALCQLLPGPASSQLGMAIGHARAGWAGALAAWVGFTLPSALIMIGLAWGVDLFAGGGVLIHGLKLAAVAVVAQAVWLMARQFANSFARAMIAILAGLACALTGGPWVQAAVILFGAIAGVVTLSAARPMAPAEGRAIRPRTGLALLALCLLLLVGLPVLAVGTHAPALAQLEAYLRAGALVFGGGHVVLPLLEQGVVTAGASDRDHFLAAYGAAQALPGPLFAVAAYPGFLGDPGGIGGALLALLAIFLPGALILFGIAPYWGRLVARPATTSALAGANAAVVGLLGAALWNPLWLSSVADFEDVLVVGVALLALLRLRAPPLIVVIGCVAASLAGTALF